MHTLQVQWVRRTALAVAMLCGAAAFARAGNVYFSDLAWNGDASRLTFLAGDAGDLRTLEVDPSTGYVRCLDPRVQDPVWSESRGKVLFRDRFGVFEVDPHANLDDAQLVVFLPRTSLYFVRAFGSDARGRLLLWTYERTRGEHALWSQATDRLERLPGAWTGNEALRVWDERNRARSFERAGGHFVRSTCVRQPGTQRRLCLENVAGIIRGRSPFFRVTMGPPGGVEVLQNRCAPAGLSASADTSRVVIGLYEELDDKGRSEVLSVWVADWRNGTRVYETLLPRVVDVRTHHDAWAYWRDRSAVLWVDAAGQLLSVRTVQPDADVLVAVPPPAARAPLFRVVATSVADPVAAQPHLESLRAAGLDAGLYDAQTSFEIQVGASATRAQARARADELRRGGYAQAREAESDITQLALDMGFGWTPASAGRGAFVRHTRGVNGIFSEIWYVERAGASPRLLVPSFETLVPGIERDRSGD